MSLSIRGRDIEKVGVIGSGNIGPDIALHWATALGPLGVQVVVVDVAEAALQAGEAKLRKKVGRLVDKGKWKPERGESVTGAVTFTSDYGQLAGAGLVVEAASEDPAIKQKIYAQLEEILAPEAVLASNTSHLEPAVIFAGLKHPERAIVAHYFFPAERNPIVELVVSEDTTDETLRLLALLYEQTGKIPVHLEARYGFAVNPVFEGLAQAAMMLAEQGVADPMQIDAVAQKVLGFGVGPFTAMNLCGGNPLTAAALPHYGEKVMPWYACPANLAAMAASGEAWPMAGRGTEVEVPEAVAAQVGEALQGAFYGLVTEIVDAGIIDVGSQELAVSSALVVKPPFAGMNKLGVDKALALVEAYAADNPGFRVPELLKVQAASGEPWAINVVDRHDEGDIAVVTIRRPAALNALNTAVFDQLADHFDAIKDDDAVRGLVLTGFGPRAFVAGADIKELVTIADRAGLVAKSRRGQAVISKLEALGKPSVAALNGLAFGGGLELAMGCSLRLAAAGQRALAGQPEPKLGVVPGYGGTQRLPRLIGVEAAWPLLRHGNPISGAEALSLGLIQGEHPFGELRRVAVEACRKLVSGELEPAAKPLAAIPIPGELPEVAIGHLSTKIDDYLKRAILEGAATTLEAGLAIEADYFGQCVDTEDFHLGIKNFLEKGPRSNAAFVHK